ncbi:MAG: aldehyde dehydrogenase family protein [Candidatus Latescibacteria bacterium]|nr:aldehyde dehydrogenase family protein [Candidatus Latescibacterota bacterium]NIO29071.1 aldehyde dehydrogenase family protein [Candidatus Latescibacterota bacterium]NIO56696.1 aldehyde dehydrogenase family protein [Candidatus Latescibacterota bacterium]NIT02279.1 aldehyde dehydrogenase family protein [Candidatus Latescibacterota bacterium]NIT39164.1 aldehyde dehydrogenase family protein [Candidatus Latescibacterota bacterium]
MEMLIAGKWVDKKEKIEVRNPYDDSLLDTVPSGTAADVDEAITAAEKGYSINRSLPVHERIRILRKAADIVDANAEDYARTIATEGSKTIREARKEVMRAVQTMTISAEEARRIVGETLPFDSVPGSENRVGYYYRFPIGIIAAITPFNDPLNLVAHKLGPAIAGGNAVVLKPATVTPLSAIKLGKALMEAGLPANVLNIVTGYGAKIGDALVTDPRIRMISFTGGVEAGEEIVKKAGLKKIGMELGSNTPVIVCKDCDMDKAVELSVSGAFWAVGQNCIGVQRIYIEEDVYEEFEKRFVERTREMKVGPQLDEDTDMGPMITEGEAKRIERWVNDAVEKGARILTGGERAGAVYQPTVLADVPPGCTIDKEEVFAPTVNLYPVRNLDEAITKANDVNFGLHAGIFTQDINNAFKAIYELDVGGIIVNDSSDYRVDLMPFGGVKKSGLGREGIKFALQEMTEPKVVCFNL